MRYYINTRNKKEVETVDETDSRQAAREMLKEYQLAFGAEFEVYISNRSTKEWRENHA